MAKGYKKKLKRHKDAVLCISAADGGAEIISGSADNTIRVWRLQKKKIIHMLDVAKPGKDALYKLKE